MKHGFNFRSCRLVISLKLQTQILKQVHDPHLGIEKTLAGARKLLYWQTIKSQIKELIFVCKVCDMFYKKNHMEPMVEVETPEYPFHMEMDIFDDGGKNFL